MRSQSWNKGKKSRKETRKEKRNQKKIKRHEHYTNRKKPGQFVLNPDNKSNNLEKINNKPNKKKPDITINTNQILSVEQHRKKEEKELKNLQKQMDEQRKKQLIEANKIEDRNIKQLEKQLKLKKRKSKGVPKSFDEDGLGYLLEVCDSESMKGAVATEQAFLDANNDFEEDLALMTGSDSSKSKKEKKQSKNIKDAEQIESLESDDDLDSFEDLLNEDDESDLDMEEEDIDDSDSELVNNKSKNPKKESEDENFSDINEDDNENGDEDISEDEEIHDNNRKEKKRKRKNSETKEEINSKKVKFPEYIESDNDEDKEENKSATKVNSDGTWEDIYGRLRGKDGSIITRNEQKYIPPAIRAKLEAADSENDKKRTEKLNRLRKQIKGLLNRLAESNMHSIASEIEELYMNNSRNDMNDSLTSLVMESLVSNAISPDRLLMEHVLLITVLHANIGTEIGAHFLQTVIRKFDEYHKEGHPVENKMLDNIVNIIAQLYNFKLFDSKLVYEVLERLSENFEEKDVECILHILRAVGFGLRKDDPLALKDLILKLQKQAASVSDETRDNSRIKFMLDILLAIKNNNVRKIPNYDTTYSEHLKKITKGFIRKGNYVTQLNITLEDLLKADERGRWWVVGSAWTGNISEKAEKSKPVKSDGYSAKLLELARKHRMNTDIRRNIFCIIMSAEDYLDAFAKLLKLGLNKQQDREIIHVILHCCLNEVTYNPYYAVLSQKFCEYDRKYQMTLKCSIWDKLKSLDKHSGWQVSHLAKLLIHLFIEKGLPISTLKIVQFTELDKVNLRFIKQILLGILLHNDLESVQHVFEKVALSEKLKMFRESLRLFIHYFLLRNLKADNVDEQKKQLLEDRAKMVERILIGKEGRLRF